MKIDNDFETIDVESRRNKRAKKDKKENRTGRVLTGALVAVAAVAVLFAAVKLGGGLLSGKSESQAAVAEAETQTETEPTTTEKPEPVVKTLKLTAVGAVALGNERKQSNKGSFDKYYEDNGGAFFFENVKELFEDDDLTIVNLESPLTTGTERTKKNSNIKGDPSHVDVLTSSSVEVAALGNDHILDYGKSGLADTKENLTAAGVTWAVDTEVGYYTTEDGLRVAVVSKELVGALKKEKEEVYSTVAACKNDPSVDLVVAVTHWGTEKSYSPSKVMKSMAHKLIDAGADVVLGTHPRVLQGMEVYNGKVICYSLGDFSWGGSKRAIDARTMIYQQTFTFVDGVLQADIDAQIIPARSSSSDSTNNFQPIILDGARKDKIISLVNKWSKKLGELTIDEDGAVRVSSMAAEALEPIAVDQNLPETAAVTATTAADAEAPAESAGETEAEDETFDE